MTCPGVVVTRKVACHGWMGPFLGYLEVSGTGGSPFACQKSQEVSQAIPSSRTAAPVSSEQQVSGASPQGALLTALVAQTPSHGSDEPQAQRVAHSGINGLAAEPQEPVVQCLFPL